MKKNIRKVYIILEDDKGCHYLDYYFIDIAEFQLLQMKMECLSEEEVEKQVVINYVEFLIKRMMENNQWTKYPEVIFNGGNHET